jgi:hypothetical protein
VLPPPLREDLDVGTCDQICPSFGPHVQLQSNGVLYLLIDVLQPFISSPNPQLFATPVPALQSPRPSH